MLFRVPIIAILFATVLQCASMSSTCAVEPKIESLQPGVISVGETQTCTIAGEGLASLYDIVFYSPGIACEEIVSKSDFEAVVKIRTDQGSPVTTVPFRLLTDDGFSSLRTLRVIDLPVIVEPQRDKKDSPVSVRESLGVALYGTLELGDYDRYAISLQKQQVCTAIVEAVRLGGPLLDTVLKVYSPSGELIQTVDDSYLYRQDPVLSFVAKEAGDYVIEIHETNYGGSADSNYLLFIGPFPKPSLVFPAGGPADKMLSVRLLDSESSGPDSFTIERLSSDGSHWYPLRLTSGQVSTPTSIPLRVSPFENVLESEACDSIDLAVKLPHSLPIAYNGILEKSGDVDYFAFIAKPGMLVRLQVFAQAVGSTIDSKITVLDSQRRIVGTNDDWTSHDSQLDFMPGSEGTYILCVSDKLNDGNPHGVYRVEATLLQPAVTAFLPRADRLSQSGQTIAVPKGNRTLVNLAVQREHVSGPATIEVSNPPDGVTFPRVEIPSDCFWYPVVVTADESAVIAGELSSVRVSSSSTSSSVIGGFAQTVDLVAGSADTLFYGVTVDRLAIAVVDPLPFTIELEQPQAQLPAGGSVKLKVTAKRAAGFDAPLRVSFPFLPPWVVCEPTLIIPAGKAEATHEFVANFEAIPRTWPLVAVAEVDVKESSTDLIALQGRQVASQIVDLTIVSPPITGEFAPLAVEQGKSFTAEFHFQTNGSVPDEMLITLEGLPNRVLVEPITVSGSKKNAQFHMQVAEDAPIGVFDSLQCRMQGTLAGQPVSFVVAVGTKLQIAAPGRLSRSDTGKLLSPLEALRATSQKQDAADVSPNPSQ